MNVEIILRRIWLFSANKIKESESFSKQPTQFIGELNSSLPHIIVSINSEKLTQNSRKLTQWQLPVIGSLVATKNKLECQSRSFCHYHYLETAAQRLFQMSKIRQKLVYWMGFHDLHNFRFRLLHFIFKKLAKTVAGSH